MDRYAQLAERVRVRIDHREGEALGVGAVMLAVDNVTDPTYAHAQDQRRGGDVGQTRHVQALAPGVNRPSDRTADNRAVDCQAAFVYLENGDGIPGVEIPLIDDVEEARADDGADDAPHRDRERVVLGEPGPSCPADGQPDADERAHGSEKAVPRDLQRYAIPLEQRGIDVDRDVGDDGNGWVLRSTGDNSTVALFDWLRRRGRQAAPPGALGCPWTS